MASTIVACGGGERQPTFAVRDSAGVAIVESAHPAWPHGAGWHLSPQPVLRIGSVEGDTAYQFSSIRSALRLSDGRIAVVSTAQHGVRFYDSTGRFLRQVGRAGGGPGEFQGVPMLQRWRGDSLMAFDGRSRSASIVSPTGAIQTVVVLEKGTAGWIGRLSDGSYLVSIGGFSPVMDTIPDYRMPTPIRHVDSAGALIDTVGVFPGVEFQITGQGRGAMVGIAPFARYLATAIVGDVLVVGTQESPEVDEYRADGQLLRRIRFATGDRTMTDSLKAAHREHYLSFAGAGDNPSQRQMLEAIFRAQSYPAEVPPYGQVLVDDAGDLWLADYEERVVGPDPGHWTVIDRTGRLLGAVAMPERFLPLDIAGGYVVGRWKDDLDVEYVVVYRLETGR
ncbi:MAG TPA: hypothetical protein VFK13_13435 [Gemmatimonadaceae bacterium]|nr:hypothetical protein [Gemmatimonadaceae bacterium]